MAGRSVAFINQPPTERQLKGFARCRFLILEDHDVSQQVRQQLLNAGAVEIDRDPLYRSEGMTFREKYVKFLGRLNIQNADFVWWAFNFTSKNYFVSPLCRQIFFSSLIIRVVNTSSDDVVVVTDDRNLTEHLEHHFESTGYRVTNTVRRPFSEIIKRKTPLGIAYCLLSKIRTAIASRGRFAAGPRSSEIDCLIVTLFNSQSFNASGSFRDTYFGSLRTYLSDQRRTSVTAGAIFEHDVKTIRQVEQQNSQDLIPLDLFTPIGRLLKWSLRSLALYTSRFTVEGNTKFDDVDVSPLITKCIREELGTGNFLLNIWFHESFTALSQKIHARTVVYPYENRSWEKMLLLAWKDSANKPHLIGYQHAAITPRHTSLFMGEGEWDATPLPDHVVTTGEAARKILIGTGRYPKDKVLAGIALRQSSAAGEKREGKFEPRRLLVILSSSIEEYTKSIRFLDAALNGSIDYEVVLRSHPTIPLDSALRVLPSLTLRYRTSSRASVAEELQESDVVLYASSTIAIEAIAVGIPVIYLDIGDFMNPDPLFDFSELKWSLAEPAQLIPTLKLIAALTPSDLDRRRAAARAYALSYLTPADASGTAAFMNLLSCYDSRP
jgi:surface carbohydrate biosynthesis protein (TIGR04326 family)